MTSSPSQPLPQSTTDCDCMTLTELLCGEKGALFHFIAIQGSGMAPLAQALGDLSALRTPNSPPLIIQGTDLQNSGYLNLDGYCHRPGSKKLQVWTGHSADYIDKALQTAQNRDIPLGHIRVIYSSAIPPHHPERLRATQLNLTQCHRSDLLRGISALSPDRIWVTGSNGKTSTTALITHLFTELGTDPTAIVGGGLLAQGHDSLPNQGPQRMKPTPAPPSIKPTKSSGYRVGRGRVFIGEADESDGTHRLCSGMIGIITDITGEHLDYHGHDDGGRSGLLASMTAFAHGHKKVVLIGGAQSGELTVTLAKQLRTIAPVPATEAPAIITVGTSDQDLYRVHPLSTCSVTTSSGGSRRGSYFELSPQHLAEHPQHLPPLPRHRYHIPTLIGKHSCLNAAFAVLACYAHTRSDPTLLEKALTSFRGVARRLEKVFESSHLTIWNDYAHNPIKVRAAVEAVRASHPGTYLETLWEPHKQDRLREGGLQAFAQALSPCDHILVAPLYEPRGPLSPPGPPPTTEEIVEKLSVALEHHRAGKHVPPLITALPAYKQLSHRSKALNYAPGLGKKNRHRTLLIMGAGRSQQALSYLGPVT